jgi:RND family efflux transporter MFP subunit
MTVARHRRNITNLYRAGKSPPSSIAYVAGDDDAAAKAAGRCLGLMAMTRILPSAAVLSVVLLCGSAHGLEAGAALVDARNPTRGSVPDTVSAYGTAAPSSGSTLTASFQRDGRVSDIKVQVGDQFKKGDVLLDFGASPAAVVAYEQAKTTLTLAKNSLTRANQLFKLQLATRDQIDTAEKSVSDAQSTIAMYEQQGSTQASELLTAPFDGVVTAISVAKGDRITAGAPLMTLSRTDQVVLSVGVEPTEIDKVKPALAVQLTSLLAGRKPIEGRVRGVGGAIDPKTRLVPVTIDIPAGSALSGEGFKAAIVVGQSQGWVIPRDAVGVDNNGAFVFQIADDHAKRVDVNVVGSIRDSSVIDGPIDPALKMVLSGNYQLADGDAVRLK